MGTPSIDGDREFNLRRESNSGSHGSNTSEEVEVGGEKSSINK